MDLHIHKERGLHCVARKNVHQFTIDTNKYVKLTCEDFSFPKLS